LSTKITDLTFEEYQAKQITEYRAAHRTATGRDGTVSVGRMILPLRRAAVPAARPSEATGWGASGVGVGVTGIRSGVRAAVERGERGGQPVSDTHRRRRADDPHGRLRTRGDVVMTRRQQAVRTIKCNA
jgi:hypothetical protein